MTKPKRENGTVLFHLENAQALLGRATISDSTDVELEEIRVHLDSAITQLKQRETTK